MQGAFASLVMQVEFPYVKARRQDEKLLQRPLSRGRETGVPGDYRDSTPALNKARPSPLIPLSKRHRGPAPLGKELSSRVPRRQLLFVRNN